MLRRNPVETGAADAVNAENVTVGSLGSAIMGRAFDVEGADYLQVVTKALSRSSTRHLTSLHLSACSMLVVCAKAALV